jgi:hypothetical protein
LAGKTARCSSKKIKVFCFFSSEKKTLSSFKTASPTASLDTAAPPESF